MSIEPIGFVTVALGVACLWLGYRAIAMAFVITTLLGSAAALFLGPNNIQPAHLFLAFLAASTILVHQQTAPALGAVAPFKPGFWLACFVAYGAFTAIFFPRLFAGATEIIPLGATQYGDIDDPVPLGPISSNITQTIYMAANVLCFVLVSAIASNRQGFRAVFNALIAYAVANTLFAVLDLATYALGAQHLLDFMRNARYTMHHQEEVESLKRIVGSFTETSSFSRATLGAFAFTGTLWLCGRRVMLAGALAVVSLALLVLSTSSTGLAGAVVVMVILYLTSLRLGVLSARRISAIVAVSAPLVVIVSVMVLLLNAEATAAVSRYVDMVVLDKWSTDSGEERLNWNAVALQNFFDTWGFGVGLGTVRTSSLMLALLSNVGIIGSALYLVFMANVLWRSHGPIQKPTSSFSADVRLAAGNACLGLIIGDMLISSTVDQSLFFYVFAAIAAAFPVEDARSYAVIKPKRAAQT